MSFVDRLHGGSLAGRLMLWFASGAMVLVVLTAGVLYVGKVQSIKYRQDIVLLKRSHAVAEVLRADRVDVDYLAHEVSEDLEGPLQLFIRVIGPPQIGVHETPVMSDLLGRELFVNVSNMPANEPRHNSFTDGQGRYFRGLSYRVPISAAAGGGWATVQMAMDTTLDETLLDQYAELALIMAAAATVVGLVGGQYIVRSQLAPLTILARDVAKIKDSTLDYRVSEKGLPTELSKFADEFNHMLERLEGAYSALRHYSDDVAHEMRTPLNRMLLAAEVALRDARTPEAYREALESMLEDCQHLAETVKSLLFLARTEHGQMNIALQPLNVAERLEKIRAFFEISATEAGVSLTVDCNPELWLMADPTLLQRAVSNLVVNAIAHTPRGGSVTIAATAGDAALTIAVADTGEGIPLEHQPHVFERFYRADKARTTDQDRVGLGLAIARAIVELHGGHLELDSAPGGTRFSIFLPRVQIDPPV
jgi:two-component system, OmpR family, heavy metal sensor histidine kinase CusS